MATNNGLGGAFRMNRNFGTPDMHNVYYFQNGSMVTDSNLDRKTPYCQLVTYGEISQRTLFEHFATFVHERRGTYVDQASNPDRPQVILQREASVRVRLSTPYLSEHEGVRAIRPVLNNNPGSYLPFFVQGDNQETVRNQVSAGLTCEKLPMCSTYGDMRSILGEHISLLPDEINPVTNYLYDTTRFIDEANERCHNRFEVANATQDLAAINMTSFLENLSNEYSLKINNGEISEEQARTEVMGRIQSYLESEVTQE